MELERKKFEAKEKILNSSLEEANEALNRLMNQLNNNGLNEKKYLERAKQDIEEKLVVSSDKINILEQLLKEKEETVSFLYIKVQ
jgi:uncharacterized protein YukE